MSRRRQAADAIYFWLVVLLAVMVISIAAIWLIATVSPALPASQNR